MLRVAGRPINRLELPFSQLARNIFVEAMEELDEEGALDPDEFTEDGQRISEMLFSINGEKGRWDSPIIREHMECSSVLKKRRRRVRRHKHKKRLRKNRYKSKK